MRARTRVQEAPSSHVPQLLGQPPIARENDGVPIPLLHPDFLQVPVRLGARAVLLYPDLGQRAQVLRAEGEAVDRPPLAPRQGLEVLRGADLLLVAMQAQGYPRSRACMPRTRDSAWGVAGEGA